MDILKAKKNGEKLGLTKGKKEEKKQFILKMYKKKMSLEDIADIVELSKEEVEEIIKENSQNK